MLLDFGLGNFEIYLGIFLGDSFAITEKNNDEKF